MKNKSYIGISFIILIFGIIIIPEILRRIKEKRIINYDRVYKYEINQEDIDFHKEDSLILK